MVLYNEDNTAQYSPTSDSDPYREFAPFTGRETDPKLQKWWSAGPINASPPRDMVAIR